VTLYFVLSGATPEQAEIQFTALNNSIAQGLGIPTKSGTTAYAEPLEHPTKNWIAIPITSDAIAFLTVDQIRQLVTRQDLYTQGFFPPTPMEGGVQTGWWQQFKGWMGF
jgi:hypothetical protein